jgi:hypothetical protein
MSIETLLNSPNATYEYPLTLANSVASASLTMATNDGSGTTIIKAICITNNATLNYLTVPAGTYNIQMICGIKPPINASLDYAQLIIVDDDGERIAYSSSKSFQSGADITTVYWVFNESQRVVFGKETLISMQIQYSGLDSASTLYNGAIAAYDININPQIILTPTF